MAISSATTITVTDNYIIGSGYTSGIYEGYYTTFSFYNYCPLCGAHGTLDVYVKGVNEITCSRELGGCDADFSFSGKDKTYHPRAWLEIYYPEPEPVISKMETPQPTPWDVVKKTYQSHTLLGMT